MTDAVTVVSHLAGGALAGLVAAVAMDVPMGRQPDGWTPAFITTAVLTRTGPGDVSFRRASVVHHAAGVAVGVLYGIVTVAFASLLPPGVWSGVSLLGHVPGVIAVTLFIYFAFAHVVLPRVGGAVYEERATAVRGQWLRSSLVFAAALTLAGPPVIVLVVTVLNSA